MSYRHKTRASRAVAELSPARLCLQELASRLDWAFSRKNYLDFGLYQEIQGRQLLKEQRQLFHYLKRRKLIEMEKIGKRLHIRLTEKGWSNSLRDKIKTTKKRCKNGWCFVIFDIPEKERFGRRTLRDFLKECGFTQIQRSVWATDKDIIKPIRQLLQRHKLERWIRIIRGNLIAASPIDKLVIHQNLQPR